MNNTPSQVSAEQFIDLHISHLIKGIAVFLLAIFIMNDCYGQTSGKLENPHAISHSQEKDPITILYDSTSNQLMYEIATDSCKTSMIVYTEDNINKGGISHRTTCPWPLTNNLSQYKELLERMFNDTTYSNLMDSVTWITWGRLGEKASEMSLRLAVAAKESPIWDTKRGRVTTGDINHLVKKLANEEVIYKELEELFASYGRKVKASSIEKVLVSRANRLDYFEELNKKGIKATDIIPFDCQIWFSLERKRE